MAPPDLEEKILDIVNIANERNEPIGKKDIYKMKLAAQTTVQYAIKRLVADGKLVEHIETLPHGVKFMLMIPEPGQNRDEVIHQKMQGLILYQTMKNGEMLEKIKTMLEESKHDAQDCMRLMQGRDQTGLRTDSDRTD